ncbi:adenosylcobinamide-GDP ribazoletransferase [Comamonas odontotermitis]|uniref:adenosylcobinamide-GDP ribazoletransferase n=1 Tax=Comamonas odontotermitis TaxID=379895 RepID=UPI001CC4601F|nr:adenosylcobinamide-GDP ribazoletransferase [Comamonas odontotermitis]UBB16642.1 adenosylcobinamide-GDP ribazoletransferase [Comamonas odontotermitis]
MQALRHFLLAVQFFTRIPITGRLANWVGYSPEMLRASAGHFPGVGWIVGLVAAGILAAFDQLLPAGNTYSSLVAAIFSTLATVLLTGCFHEDGLTDVVDGLGGSHDRERALDIMKDSRIGAYGAMAMLLAVLSKVALLALLTSHRLSLAMAALIGAHVIARLWPMLVVRSLPHVGDTAKSKSKPLAEFITRKGLVSCMLWALPSAVLVAWWQGLPALLPALALSAAAALWMRQWFHRRLQGFTGDGLGAIEQVSEIGFYLGVALSIRPSF